MDFGETVKILCVDDEKNVLRSLERIFLDDDYEILTATSGDEGLLLLENEGPVQIVISDYRMPVMDGVEFLKAVYKRWPDTVRIVLSGYADAAAIVAAINDGHIYKFIPKPWNDDELRVTIINSLERYFLQKRNRELMAELSSANDELERKVEKRTYELELRNHALTFSQSVLNALPVAVIGIDSEGMIVQGSRSAVQIFTGIAGGLLGSDRHDALPAEFNHAIDDLADKKVSRLTWHHNDVRYDVRINTLHTFDQTGVVITMIDMML
ncbi:MAG: histidine kinase [Geobacter sp.]|nr:MAG: histidine kinase [Geobacter sp.]